MSTSPVRNMYVQHPVTNPEICSHKSLRCILRNGVNWSVEKAIVFTVLHDFNRVMTTKSNPRWIFLKMSVYGPQLLLGNWDHNHFVDLHAQFYCVHLMYTVRFNWYMQMNRFMFLGVLSLAVADSNLLRLVLKGDKLSMKDCFQNGRSRRPVTTWR